MKLWKISFEMGCIFKVYYSNFIKKIPSLIMSWKICIIKLEKVGSCSTYLFRILKMWFAGWRNRIIQNPLFFIHQNSNDQSIFVNRCLLVGSININHFGPTNWLFVQVLFGFSYLNGVHITIKKIVDQTKQPPQEKSLQFFS